MLPKCETIGDEAPETYVTEEIYEILRINLAGLMGDKDDYVAVTFVVMAMTTAFFTTTVVFAWFVKSFFVVFFLFFVVR